VLWLIQMNANPPLAAIYPAAGDRVPQVRRLVVLRANAVGDFVVALPALAALRHAYPRAHITLLGRRWHAEFLQNRPGPVDEVIELPDVPGVTVPPQAEVDAAALAAFVARMRARQIDLALQLHGGGRYSNRFLLQLGARVSAGLRAPDAAALDRNLDYLDDHHPVTLQLLECVALVGATVAGIEPRLQLRPQDLVEAERLLPPDGQPLVVLQPSATDPRRRWHPGGFAAVGDALAARGARIVLNGSADDVAVNRAVVAAMRSPALDLAGRLSIGGLCAVLARARLLVSNDTGPLHLARALDTPTVAVYWIGNVRSFGPLSTSRHRVAVSWRMHCVLCGRHCMQDDCDHVESLVDDVPADTVREMAEALYACASEALLLAVKPLQTARSRPRAAPGAAAWVSV
jgi:ADP-heptose:LPS heptosyltransferase